MTHTPKDPQEQPGGRLIGPEAGWRAMERNLAADQVAAAAEAAAHGHRYPPRGDLSDTPGRLPPTTEEGPDDEPDTQHRRPR